MQSHLGSVPPCPRGRSRSRPTPPTSHAPGRESQSSRRKITSPMAGAKCLSKVVAKATLCKIARVFLSSYEVPTCFTTKCEGRNDPVSATVCRHPLPEDSHTVWNEMICFFPRLTKSEEMAGHTHQAYKQHREKGKELSGKRRNGKGSHWEMAPARVEITTKDLCKGSVWSRRHAWPLRTGTERKHNQQPGREMGRVGTHPRAPPPTPKLQIFKLCRHATVPQSQLLGVVGARCSRGSQQTSQALLAAPSPAPLTRT